MIFHHQDKYISGVLTVLPKNIIYFRDEISNYAFSKEQSLKLARVMGLEQRRVAEIGTCASDLCIAGLNFLIQNDFLKKEEINALLFISQTPDYQMPPTSNIIHGVLGLNQEVICLDINQGCAGYLVGLIQAFQLLDQKDIHQVILLNADVLSPKVSQFDRNSAPLIGDAAALTLVKKNNQLNPKITSIVRMDGSGAMALQIPAGAARIPYGDQTSIMQQDDSGNRRSLNHLVMRGDEVFNFVMNRVPELIVDSLRESKESLSSIDAFLFHQPNQFILQKLADTVGIPYEKMPADTVNFFGNSSGATIPVTLTQHYQNRLKDEVIKIFFCGFGVGLTWASTIMNVGELDFCEILEV
jgi:3-oxoacyl-[acyl-carrier-protein] synthase-3